MATDCLTIRLTPELIRNIRARAGATGKNESEVAREALTQYLAESEPKTAYDAAVAAGLIGSARRLPRDLATNKKYFEGFGQRLK